MLLNAGPLALSSTTLISHEAAASTWLAWHAREQGLRVASNYSITCVCRVVCRVATANTPSMAKVREAALQAIGLVFLSQPQLMTQCRTLIKQQLQPGAAWVGKCTTHQCSQSNPLHLCSPHPLLTNPTSSCTKPAVHLLRCRVPHAPPPHTHTEAPLALKQRTLGILCAVLLSEEEALKARQQQQQQQQQQQAVRWGYVGAQGTSWSENIGSIIIIVIVISTTTSNAH